MAYKVAIVIISLIFLHHLVTCSPNSHPRRLLGSSVKSVSSNPLGAPVNESSVTSIEASLRKRPPTASNPIQNYFLIGSRMGSRNRGKGKILSLIDNNGDPASREDDKILSQKQRGRPQKPLMDEDVEKTEEEDDDENASSDLIRNRKRKRDKEGKKRTIW
ncbi:hypothetical protein QVD17_00952 [Tagetes erecta]|uniref:Uncharacterized protein n=1 Tax=Tagetes erecta TaxID=13708 RepID=A0AAD8L9M7_TARER|nr:hypothetical protein QVD17_00952 [Tagetes erecta]